VKGEKPLCVGSKVWWGLQLNKEQACAFFSQYLAQGCFPFGCGLALLLGWRRRRWPSYLITTPVSSALSVKTILFSRCSGVVRCVADLVSLSRVQRLSSVTLWPFSVRTDCGKIKGAALTRYLQNCDTGMLQFRRYENSDAEMWEKIIGNVNVKVGPEKILRVSEKWKRTKQRF